MLRVFPYITLCLLVYIMLMYLEYQHPNFFRDSYDWAIEENYLPAMGDERSRLAKIGNLNGPDAEQKMALRRHTVYIGASAEMVELALGAPKQVLFMENSGGTSLYYVYFLAHDNHPTVFVFDCNDKKYGDSCKSMQLYRDVYELNKAYKKSVDDINNNNFKESNIQAVPAPATATTAASAAISTAATINAVTKTTAPTR